MWGEPTKAQAIVVWGRGSTDVYSRAENDAGDAVWRKGRPEAPLESFDGPNEMTTTERCAGGRSGEWLGAVVLQRRGDRLDDLLVLGLVGIDEPEHVAAHSEAHQL